jgi:Tol biopolymer transport system component/C-terminal processing protease CtpA/Prc
MITTRSSALLLLVTLATAPLGAQEARPFLYQPAPSPDGSEIAFVSSGDIWVVPAAGGDAHLLVSHEADESRPLYAPDGTRLAFVSDRDGYDDIYVLTLATGEVRRLTWGDGAEELDAWSPDGRWIWFADGRGDPDGKADVWRVAAEGGTPMRVLADRFAPEFHAAVSPDGRTVAIAAVAGMAQSQWWRHGHAHIDESEIWLASPGDPPTYRKLSASGSKNVSPMWSADGSTVVYVSDRSGAENLWSQPAAGGDARALTDFRDGRLLFPTVSADGRTVAFERDFGIWRTTLPDGRAERVAVTLDGAPQRTGVQHLSLTSGFGELALSPDGKKVAFTARGEVFAASAKDGGQATRVTRTLAPEEEITWAPDSRRIAYTSRRSGRPKLFLYDFGSGEERALTTGNGSDVTPRFSPDGVKVAYVRDGREVHVLDVASGSDRRVAQGQLWTAPFTLAEPLVWSPDGAWLAYFATDARMFTNVWVAAADGDGEARAVSELANSFAGSMVWSKDGNTIYFDTQHRTENGEIARVDLVPRTPTFREDRFQELFEEEKEGVGGADSATAGGQAADSTTRIVFEAVRRRLELLPTGVDVGSVTLSPDGKTLVFSASAEGQQNLYAFSVDPERDEPAVTRQITSTPGFKSLPRFTPDGKEVYFLDRGRIRAANVASGDGRAVAVTAELDVDFDQEKVEAFDEGWTYLRDNFYDAAYHGADWQAVRRTFEPYIRGAGTRAEYSRLMNMMVGELNASHLGHGVQGPSGPSTGELGLRFDRTAYESSGRLRVTEVVHLGPADVSGQIAPGDFILAVDGTEVGQGTNLDRLLRGKVGDKVTLRVAADASGAGARTVSVQPMSAGQATQLAYRDWVEANRAYVDSVSGGRLGYVHMRDMGWGSYRQLVEDLDAANFGKDGVVIDIRANHGGFVNAYALDVFSRRGYLTLEIRGYPEAPARSLLGQRALEKPTVLVVNQHTLSDGEDFTEGYRTLGLGKVVGVPTAGWIIYTWGLQLVDGSSLRMPRSRVRGHDGEVMERNPRPVDVEVVRPMGESYTGRDSQLDAAVRVLTGGSR